MQPDLPVRKPPGPLSGTGNGVIQMTIAPSSQGGSGAGWEVGENVIHYLTLGHLDPEAIRECAAVAVKPLDAGIVHRVTAEFPSVKAEYKGGMSGPMTRS